MERRGRGWALAVLAFATASLAGWPPLATIEQAPAEAARYTEGLALSAAGLLTPLLPEGPAVGSPEGGPPVAGEEERDVARRAWALYAEAVAGTVGAARPGRRDVLAPVVPADDRSGRLVLRVPPGAVEAGAPVTHRDVLLGFVASLSPDGGRATVTLLGDDRTRPVAGEWRAAPGGRGHSFLGVPRDGRLAMEHRSDTVRPSPDLVATTRDVQALGDDLPAGLLLGRVSSGPTDEPGGGLGPSADDPGSWTLRALLDASRLGVAMVECAPGAILPTAALGGALSRATGGRDRWRVDRGRDDGVLPGHWVVQDGVLVGLVEASGPGTSVVAAAPPPGRLLVVEPDGRVIATSADEAGWPAGWRPRAGLPVVAGHPGTGGLFVGVLEDAGGPGLQVRRPAVDLERPVLLVQP